MRRTVCACLFAVLAGCSDGDGSSTTEDTGSGLDDSGTPLGDDGTPLADDGTDAPAPSDGGSDATKADATPTDGGPPPSKTCGAPIKLVDTSSPAHVVGDGSAASCTAAALASAVAKGGIITFACGASPLTIKLDTPLEPPTNADTVIDGGGLITLDGGDKTRIIDAQLMNYRTNDKVLTLQRLTFVHGKANGEIPFPTAPAPCSQGFKEGGGGAVIIRDIKLHVIDCDFHDNAAAALGPDVGGGAIYTMGSKEVIVASSTFTNNTGANSGAIGSLNSQLDVYDSVFTNNRALGHGGNSDDASKCSVIAPTGQHQVGSGGNGGAIAIDGGDDTTHTFCGDRFVGNQGGESAFGGALFRTPDGPKQTTVIDRTVFDANTGSGGGALYFHNSTLKIVDSTLANNVGEGPGALQSDGTTLDFTNVTFYANKSSNGLGAGLADFGGDGKIVNCTFAKNVCAAANMFACAIFGSPTLTIRNSIFDGNTGTNPTEPMQCKVSSSGSGDLQWPRKHVSGGSDDGACVPGITWADPKLGTLGDHGGPVPTVLPEAGSPAIGIGTDCPATDARGHTRTTTKCAAGAAEP